MMFDVPPLLCIVFGFLIFLCGVLCGNFLGQFRAKQSKVVIGNPNEDGANEDFDVVGEQREVGVPLDVPVVGELQVPFLVAS